MKREIAVSSIISSVPCAIACLLLTFAPSPLNGLCWCLFAGYCTTYLAGGNLKKMPNIWTSYGVGILWAFVFNYFFVWLLSLGASFSLAMLLDVEICTAVLLFVHIAFLMNTWANIIPMLFPPIFFMFQSGGDLTVYPFMIIALLAGSFAAIMTDPFTNLFLKKKEQAE